MLVDIFSSFDDNNQVFMSLYIFSWLFSLGFLVVFSMSFWVLGAQWSSVIVLFESMGTAQSLRGMGKKLKGFINVVGALFLFLIFMNLVGLIPYVFSPTSHLAVSLSLGFPLWFALIISSLEVNPSVFVASLLPMGAPGLLNPFLVIVETVSISVRPLTLSIRLMANMSAGHIVLTIIGSYFTASLFSSSSVFLFLGLLQVFYTIFEFGISVIQAYIFCLLISLYCDDHSPWLVDDQRVVGNMIKEMYFPEK